MEKQTLIPVYLEAKSKGELIMKMWRQNAANSTHFKYKTPQKVGKKYEVWFFMDIVRHVHIDGIEGVTNDLQLR